MAQQKPPQPELGLQQNPPQQEISLQQKTRNMLNGRVETVIPLKSPGQAEHSSTAVDKATGYGQFDVFDKHDITAKPHKIRASHPKASRSSTYLAVPVTLSWQNLEVKVAVKRNRNACSNCAPKRVILRKVNGFVRTGTLIAIMGSSGAGKSTLMNVLTARNIKGLEVAGTIFANGVPVGREIRNISAYVQQDDLFLGTLTVREQLQFRALIQMDKSYSKDQRMIRVEDVIMEMGLTACANSEIGEMFGSGRGISGGERKRLSFASETLNRQPLIFCDEPTSGLDTFMAQNIVNSLQHMASKGHTVLVTIHQPSSELFAMFHQLLLMSGGRVAYDGSTQDAMAFFTRLNHPCPLNFNPADHYILTLAIRPGKEEECRDRAVRICDAFSISARSKEIDKQLEEIIKDDPRDIQNLKDIIAQYQGSKASYWTQFRWLFWRSWVSLFRNVFLFRIRFAQAVIFALVLGSIYYKMEITQKGVMNFNGAIFVLIINVTFSNAFAVFNSFPSELGIFLREYGSGLYRTDVYFLATTIAETPMFTLMSILFVSVVYWMMGFYNSMDTFMWAQLVLFLTSMIGTSFGYFISTMCGSVEASLAVGPPILIPFMLFGGFFLNVDSIPFYFKWINYISWFRYAYEVFMVKQWINIDHIECVGNPTWNAMNKLQNNVTQTSDKAAASIYPIERCSYRHGGDVLTRASFHEEDVMYDTIMLCVLLIGFRVLAFFALLLRAYQSKE